MKARRAALGIASQEDLARISGVRVNTIARYEAGITKSPEADKLVAIADALQTTTDYLLGRTDDPSVPGSGNNGAPVDLALKVARRAEEPQEHQGDRRAGARDRRSKRQDS